MTGLHCQTSLSRPYRQVPILNVMQTTHFNACSHLSLRRRVERWNCMHCVLTEART